MCRSLGKYTHNLLCIYCWALERRLTIGSGVLSLDQIPMAIQSGMRAVVVQFDVWGFTRLVANSLEEGWKCAKEFEGSAKPE
jgi:4-hydroxy-2-oxoheptanedioate aldolase